MGNAYLREVFLENNIPYDDIDPEMIEILDVLNFDLGLKTKFCCYGHDNKTNTYVILDECVADEQIFSLAEKLYKEDGGHIISFAKWVRSLCGKPASNWKVEIGVLFEYPNHPLKKLTLDKAVEILENVAE